MAELIGDRENTEQAAQRATIGATWVQVAMLALTLITMIVGGAMFQEVRAAHSEWQNTAQERQGSDHEQRLRVIEGGMARLEGKVDAIGAAVGARRP